ncbi:carbamate kinase [Spiroplasma endosymbiont of Crioceris asparagi]|uniref:carbamate kinase n=1 Tax=Spiroplasma endosymbiont of Crioceris asparagi TaxID=3066286 RepID=UPI0030CBE6F0
MSKIVIAIGGNALGNSPSEQKQIVKNTAKYLVDIIEEGHSLTIVHGNGPQVGMINLGFSLANEVNKNSPIVDFPECGSMSQGYIGYHLQNALNFELSKRSINKNVATIITQTVVDKNDIAFQNPSKPIGSFYKEEDAKKLASENKWSIKEDAGRGWRRVIASPKPIDIVEKEVIKKMMESNFVTITAGGGGIPVIKEKDEYVGVAAVIDKDFAAAKVAEIIKADKFIILTAVNKVMINYKKENQISLDEISLLDCKKYIDENQFAPGSMLPKIQAAMSFVEKTKIESYIGSLEEAKNVIHGKGGTKIF